MSARVLIVRTVSIEELGPLVAACRAQWPDAELAVLSSPNRRAEIAASAGVHDVIDYPAAVGGFGAPWTDGRSYDAVVVPVRNGSGWGYANVWQAIAPVEARSFWLAQWSRSLVRVSPAGMRVRGWVERAVQRMAGPPAGWLAQAFLSHSKGPSS